MIDVTITGSGRWKYLKRTIESFTQNVSCSERFRFLVTDDAGYHCESNGTRKAIVDSGVFDAWHFTKRQDYSECIAWLYANLKSEFFFHLQDDWEFLKPVNLDPLIALMRHHRSINHIKFNKRKTRATLKPEAWNHLGKLPKRNTVIDGIPLVAYPYWAMHPSLNRTSFVHRFKVPRSGQKEYDRAFKPSRWERYWLQTLFVGVDRKNPKDSCRKVGTYIYGKIGSPPYILHIGEDRALNRRTR